jgi:hypothetical protein
LGKERNEAHKKGSSGIHGDEGLLLQVGLNRACLSALCLEQQYMVEMVEARKNGDKVEQRYDLFSGLLDAAQDELDHGAALSDDELIGGHCVLNIVIDGKRHNRSSRKHVYISSCWTRGGISSFLRCCL